MIDDSELSRLVREATPPRAAPAALHEWARTQVRGGSTAANDVDLSVERRRRKRTNWWTPSSRSAAGLLLALGLGAAGGAVGHALIARTRADAAAQRAIGAELVDAHVGSLMVDHLIDVRS